MLHSQEKHTINCQQSLFSKKNSNNTQQINNKLSTETREEHLKMSYREEKYLKNYRTDRRPVFSHLSSWYGPLCGPA